MTYTAGIGGSLNNGNNTQTQTVNYGGNGTAVTAVPSGGYYFTGWSDGNLSNPRTDLNVTSNLSVTANFSNQYTLVYTAGSGGTLSGSASQIVIYNGNGTAITAVPNSGYHFVNWSDGSTSNPRTDTGIHANLSVTANFTTTQFTLTYTAGSNGTLNGGSPQTQTINQGSNGSPVTAVANSGYHFVNWSDLSTANPRTDTNVQGNISVTARFTVDCGDSFVDARDSNSYPIVSIGFQCWMAKNLAYLPSVSPSASGNDTDPYYYVYNYQGTNVTTAKAQANYTTYGVLYNYPSAISACPSGWHLPTHDEFTDLERFICTSASCVTDFPYDNSTIGNRGTNEGSKLSSYTLNGNNSSGFSGLMPGIRTSISSFLGIGGNGPLWSSTILLANNYPWVRYLYSSAAYVRRMTVIPSSGLPVRCIKN